MTKLYLITGFLGAGKTTFLQQFAWLFVGQKLSILVNEFGKEDVDSQLLKDLQARLAEIHNGSIFCTCRLEQFEQALMELTAENSDVILVETSGLSDPTNIQRILSDPKKFENVLYMGCICLADAINFEKVYATAMACKKQLEVSNVVVLNKTDLVMNTNELRKFIEQNHPNVTILETSFGKIPPNWIDTFRQPPSAIGPHSIQTKDLTIQSYLVTISETFPVEQLADFLKMFAGETYRIKGFVCLNSKSYYVDCVEESVKVSACKTGSSPNRIVVLAGQGMHTLSAIQLAIKSFEPFVVSVES
ncbi:MAG: GTP-binding protein [Eubacteriales bacterium]